MYNDYYTHLILFIYSVTDFFEIFVQLLYADKRIRHQLIGCGIISVNINGSLFPEGGGEDI